MTKKKIAYQGEPGANSDIACRAVYPDCEPLPRATFEDVLAAVTDGAADCAMIPIENSLAGRVADIHALLPTAGLYIVGEYFLPIHFQLLGLKGAKIEASNRSTATSMRSANAGRSSASIVSSPISAATRRARRGRSPNGAIRPKPRSRRRWRRKFTASIFSPPMSRTRSTIRPVSSFWRASRAGRNAGTGPVLTTFVFRVRNVPAALYKALGGFATNGVNMTKLESYMVDGEFTATQFLADVDGHPEEPALARALEELAFFCKEFKILGVYPSHPFRSRQRGCRRAGMRFLGDAWGRNMLSLPQSGPPAALLPSRPI